MRSGSEPNIFLEFGPTAVTQNERAPDRVYLGVFGTRQAGAGIDRILKTKVTLEEVLAGLADDDQRLVNAVATLIQDPSTPS